MLWKQGKAAAVMVEGSTVLYEPYRNMFSYSLLRASSPPVLLGGCAIGNAPGRFGYGNSSSSLPSLFLHTNSTLLLTHLAQTTSIVVGFCSFSVDGAQGMGLY